MLCTDVTYEWDDANDCEREIVGTVHKATKVRSWAFGRMIGVCIDCGATVEMEVR